MTNYDYRKSGMLGPAEGAFSVTPSDTEDLPKQARGLYIGGSGDIYLDTPNDQNVPFIGLVAGTPLPVRVVRVRNTNTTATNIVALY